MFGQRDVIVRLRRLLVLLFCSGRNWKNGVFELVYPKKGELTMSERKRRHFSGQEKVQILKRHLVEKVPVSDLCDQHQLQPAQVYAWLKEFFENGHPAFDNGRKSKADTDAKDRKIAQLQEKLLQKNEVVAELAEAFTDLNKLLGKPEKQVDRARHPRQRRRSCQALERQDGDSRLSLFQMDQYLRQQVPSVETTLWQSQRA